MVNWSVLLVPEPVNVTVIVVLVTTIDDPVILLPVECETEPTPGLNSKPVGTVKIIVPNTEISPLFV